MVSMLLLLLDESFLLLHLLVIYLVPMNIPFKGIPIGCQYF